VGSRRRPRTKARGKSSQEPRIANQGFDDTPRTSFFGSRYLCAAYTTGTLRRQDPKLQVKVGKIGDLTLRIGQFYAKLRKTTEKCCPNGQPGVLHGGHVFSPTGFFRSSNRRKAAKRIPFVTRSTPCFYNLRIIILFI